MRKSDHVFSFDKLQIDFSSTKISLHGAKLTSLECSYEDTSQNFNSQKNKKSPPRQNKKFIN